MKKDLRFGLLNCKPPQSWPLSMASAFFTRASRPVSVSCSACRAFVSPSSSVIGSSTTAAAAAAAAPQSTPSHHYSTTTRESTNESPKPRWSYTPPRAKAPFSLRFGSKRPDYLVNSSPQRLDEFYIRLLGEDGEKMLSEEVKWLAVTHKSYDQGRRGFNDRLAFIGKRIIHLQASLALVQNPANSIGAVAEDPFGREHFAHPALDGLKNLSDGTKALFTGKDKLAGLANQHELLSVLRWAPRMPQNLAGSGVNLVMAHTMYAIVGAIALEKGGYVANKIAQERILEPLGVKTIA